MKHLAFLLLALFLAPSAIAASSGTLSANGDTDTMTCDGPVATQVTGTWGGGTITWYLSDAGEWRAIPGATLIGDDALYFAYPSGIKSTVKGTLTGSTNPNLIWIIRCKAPPAS